KLHARERALAALLIWIRIRENRNDKCLHFLRAKLLVASDASLPECRSRTHEHCQGGDEGGCDSDPVSRNELAERVPRGVGLGEHGAPVQPARQILGERIHRAVAFAWLLLQRLEGDCIQITTQHSRLWRAP